MYALQCIAGKDDNIAVKPPSMMPGQYLGGLWIGVGLGASFFVHSYCAALFIRFLFIRFQ